MEPIVPEEKDSEEERKTKVVKKVKKVKKKKEKEAPLEESEQEVPSERDAEEEPGSEISEEPLTITEEPVAEEPGEESLISDDDLTITEGEKHDVIFASGGRVDACYFECSSRICTTLSCVVVLLQSLL